MTYNDSDHIYDILKQYIYISSPRRAEEQAKTIEVCDSMTHYTLFHT